MRVSRENRYGFLGRHRRTYSDVVDQQLQRGWWVFGRRFTLDHEPTVEAEHALALTVDAKPLLVWRPHGERPMANRDLHDLDPNGLYVTPHGWYFRREGPIDLNTRQLGTPRGPSLEAAITHGLGISSESHSFHDRLSGRMAKALHRYGAT